jgi:hypothetical protein
MPEMTRFVGVDKFLPRWSWLTVYSLQIGREKKKRGEEINAEIAESAEGAETEEEKREEKRV